MVKILVVSDTHKNISNAIDIIEDKNPDYILHLGDLTDDSDELRHMYPLKEVIGVCGNCDWMSFSNAPSERMIDVDGVKILMSHGHMYSVKNGIESYVAAANEKKADIALFGHTHIPILEYRCNLVVMNPGTVTTYGWIEIADGKINARMCVIGE